MAPSSISRSGCRYTWKCRPVRRRPISSTQPISMIRWPSPTGIPVVSVSRTTLRTLRTPHIVYTAVGQLVGPLVARVAGMAAHPLPGDLVPPYLLVQLPPQVGILHRLLGRGFPATFLPVGHPFLNTLHHILGVGNQAHLALALQFGQGTNGRGQLHAVIGGLGLAAPQLLLDPLEDQQCPPATHARITLAGTVGIDLDLFTHLAAISHSIYSVGSTSVAARGG